MYLLSSNISSDVNKSNEIILNENENLGEKPIESIARQAIKEIGYSDVNVGMDHKTATVIVAVDHQSSEIANSVHVNKNEDDIGAGDQGLMIGYATD